ncbi:hypothetical protein FIM08_00540 [SAR202 cluster bacterium AC-647-N09_OGT_505m]|nr:hypothetical protein [SAR202 cluster bacterium AC-647-N09_OGT_505m]
MNCPRCQTALSMENYKGVEVDRCASCKGMWLEYHELDQLEDKELNEYDVKGSLMFRSYQGDLHCPTCGSGMQMFHYRAYDLELDFCPNEHGFWLDSGEEKRVLEVMKQRIKDLKRSSNAEVEWADMLKRFKSRGFADRIKGMFRR